MPKLHAALSSLLFGLAALPALAGEPPSSPEFQVNFFTTGSHITPHVGRAANGDFVAVWQFGSQVLMRGFDSDATPSFEGSVEILPDTFDTTPTVIVAQTGEFVVSWNHLNTYGPDGVRARSFGADGTPLAPGFMMSNIGGGYQGSAAMAYRPGGGFIVTWEGQALGPDTSESSVQAELFDAAGNSEGPNFLVNTTTTSFQYLPSVAATGDGSILVVWSSASSSGTDTDLSSVQGRLFDAGGLPAGLDFQVNTYTTGQQAYPAVTADPAGGFLVVWSGAGAGDSQGVFGQRLDTAAAPIGSEFQINSYTTQTQELPVVAASNGGFVVAWQSYAGSPGNDNDSYSVLARTLDSAGAPGSPDFQVNTLTAYYQRRPSIAATPGGDFTVVWQSTGSVEGDTGESAAGRLYFGAIFEDGFESGDTSAWSSTVP